MRPPEDLSSRDAKYMTKRIATASPFVRPSVTAVMMALAALAVTGCKDTSSPAPPATGPATQPATRPEQQPKLDIPKDVPGLKEAGLGEDNPGSAEIMVKAAYDRIEKQTYTCDPKYPAGTLVGSCAFVTYDVKSHQPDPAIDIAGAYAVKDPLPKEVDYYKNVGLRDRSWILQRGRGKHAWYQPNNVVLRLRGITKGRRPQLTRPVMMIRQGRIAPGDDTNFGANNVQFAPMHERAQFTTWDAFPSHILLTKHDTRAAVFQETVRYVQTEDNKDDRHTTGHLAYKPQFVITAPLRDPGLYVVTDTRHPWTEAYLFVVDNPYVAVTARDYKGRANFRIDGVPPGTHTIDVWHPLCKPVKQTLEVEVLQDQIKELLIKFHPPAPRRDG